MDETYPVNVLMRGQRREASLPRGLVPAASQREEWGQSRQHSSTAGLCPGKWLDSEEWLLRHSGTEVLRTLLVTIFKTAPPSPPSSA